VGDHVKGIGKDIGGDCDARERDQIQSASTTR